MAGSFAPYDILAVMAQWLDLKSIISICALCFAVFAFWWTRRGARKALSYDYEIARISELQGVATKLVLTFEDKKVSDVSIVTISLRNSGRVPIIKKDFDEDLVFTFNAQQILSADVTKVDPADVSVTIDHYNSPQPHIRMIPCLLNSGDEITISCLATAFKEVSVFARIVGVKSIERKALNRGRKTQTTTLLIVLCACITVCSGVVVNLASKYVMLTNGIAFVVLTMSLVVCGLSWYLLRTRR